MLSRTLLIAGIAAALFAAFAAPGPEAGVAGEVAGCNPSRPHAAGEFEQSIGSRDYLLHVPPAYDGAAPLPVVLNLHGLGMTAEEQRDYTGFDSKADEAGFITVTPQGRTSALVDEPHWNFVLAPSIFGEPNDLAFIEDVLDEIEADLCVDPQRIYSTGYSNGGFMSVRLACSLGERIAAIAAVAGVYYPPVTQGLPIEEECPDERPVPIIVFHGTDDPIVPFEGGPSLLNYVVRAVETEIMPDWTAHNGCFGSFTTFDAPGVRKVRYLGCDAGASTVLYVIEDADGDGPGTEGGGHQWPDPVFERSPGSLGHATHEINANDLIWDFFESHALPLYGKGDIDCSGALSSVDALKLLQVIAGLGISQQPGCPIVGAVITGISGDIDCDGDVDSVDALLVLRFLAGLPVNLPPGCAPLDV